VARLNHTTMHIPCRVSDICYGHSAMGMMAVEEAFGWTGCRLKFHIDSVVPADTTFDIDVVLFIARAVSR
jgi:hypothetical protein